MFLAQVLQLLVTRLFCCPFVCSASASCDLDFQSLCVVGLLNAVSHKTSLLNAVSDKCSVMSFIIMLEE